MRLDEIDCGGSRVDPSARYRMLSTACPRSVKFVFRAEIMKAPEAGSISGSISSRKLKVRP